MAVPITFLRPPQGARLARIQAVAPEHPPCFDSRSQWLEYLAWCNASDEPDMSPLACTPGNAPLASRQFNTSLPFCRDCVPSYQADMLKQGRCNARHLIGGQA